MKKTIVIALLVLILASIGVGCYFLPDFRKKQEAKRIEKVSQVNSVFVTKILEEFNLNPMIKPSRAAQKIVDELNSKTKNPYDSKNQTYTFEADCKGCSSVQFDDNLNLIIITTYDKKGVLDARSVIKPPSVVTYTKEEAKK